MHTYIYIHTIYKYKNEWIDTCMNIYLDRYISRTLPASSVSHHESEPAPPRTQPRRRSHLASCRINKGDVLKLEKGIEAGMSPSFLFL